MFLSMLTPTFCRLCERACGLLAEVEGGALRALAADPSDPVCGGAAPCGVAAASVGARRDPRRPLPPQKRVGGALVPVPWREGLRVPGVALRPRGAANGGDALGPVGAMGRAVPTGRVSRSIAHMLAAGTPTILTGPRGHGVAGV